MRQKKENCPFAFRAAGDPNVLCEKLKEQPGAKWYYCPHQYRCTQTGRWEATKVAKDCKYRQK